jgi:predicted glycoside hydrolase/deacetylase ChbG (UPF0249 family)
MAREILFIADDFGIDHEVNRAIVHAHRNGVLDGAALMMGQPGSDEAVAMARDNPTLQIGWHLHLTDSRPCTLGSWPWRPSPAAAGFAIGLRPSARARARQEIAEQWRLYSQTGLECRFVNAHHHLHIHPVVRRMLLDLLPSIDADWIRWGEPRFFDRGAAAIGYAILDRSLQTPHRARLPLRPSTTLWGIDRSFAMNADEIAAVIPTLGDGLHEFMFHPRRVDGDADATALIQLRGMLSRD